MAADTEVTPTVENTGDSDEDLASEIARTISRKPRETVTCRRVTKGKYRCNWWAPSDTAAYDNPGMQGLLVTTSRISQSQFLQVTKVDGNLKINVVAGGPAPRN